MRSSEQLRSSTRDDAPGAATTTAHSGSSSPLRPLADTIAVLETIDEVRRQIAAR